MEEGGEEAETPPCTRLSVLVEERNAAGGVIGLSCSRTGRQFVPCECCGELFTPVPEQPPAGGYNRLHLPLTMACSSCGFQNIFDEDLRRFLGLGRFFPLPDNVVVRNRDILPY